MNLTKLVLVMLGSQFTLHSLLGETIAILPSGESSAAIVDLAEVELSQAAGIELVDRSRVEQTLKEQRLSAFGDGSDTLLLGQLLSVDKFVVWEQSNREFTGRLVVLDAKRGTRLDDRICTAENDVTVSHQIALSIKAISSSQSTASTPDRQLVSLISVRNVDLPPNRRTEISQFVAAFERAVATHAKLTLLERTRLRYVTLEQTMPLATRQAELLSAATLVTLEFSRNGDALNIKLLAKQHGQELAHELTSDVRAEGSIEAASREFTALLAALNQTPSAHDRAQEIATLLSEGARLLAGFQPLPAALCFESAYALGARGIVSNQMIQALENQIYASLGSNTSPAPILILTNEQWLDLAKLAKYRLHFVRESHTQQMSRLGWPFVNQPERRPVDDLTPDFLWTCGLFPFLGATQIDPQQQPAAFAAVQDCLMQAFALIFQKFAGDARAKLSGDELLRFTLELKAKELLYWSRDELRHFMPNWPQRFTELFAENLNSENWLVNTALIVRASEHLPSSMVDKLLAKIELIDEQKYPRLLLAMKYMELRHRILRTQNPSPSTRAEIDQQVENLVRQLTHQYARIEDDPAKVVTASNSLLQVSMNVQQAALNDLLKNTIQLVRDEKLRSKMYCEGFSSTFRDGYVVFELTQWVLMPSNRDPALVALIDESIPLVEARPQSFASHKDLIRQLKRKRELLLTHIENPTTAPDSVAIPLAWKIVQEVEIQESTKIQCNILNSAINGEYVYIESRYQDPQRAVTVLQLHRRGLEVDSPLELINRLEIKQSLIDARMKQTQNGVNLFQQIRDFLTHTFDQHVIGFTDTEVLIPSAAGGLFVFPKNGRDPFVLDTDSGLPSNYVQQVVSIGSTAYAWVGEPMISANLVSIDLTTREVRVLVSCQREQLKTPLDNFPGAICELMVATPRNELVMTMTGRTIGYEPSRTGVWVYNPKQDLFRPMDVITDGRLGRVCGTSKLALRRYDSAVNGIVWGIFDLSTYQLRDLPTLKELLGGIEPYWYDGSAVWWHRRFVTTAFRHDLASGKTTELRVLPDGNTSVISLHFYGSENVAVVRSELNRIWLLRELHFD